MPTVPDDKHRNADDQPTPEQQPFKGVRKYYESCDVAVLMRELDKVPTDTKEAILNKLSMSDGKNGRIELDSNDVIPMPENIRTQAQGQLKKKQQLEQEDAT